MKRIFLVFNIIIFFFITGCKKEGTGTLSNQVEDHFFDSVVGFLKTKLSADDFSRLNLNSNKILRYRSKNIGMQIFEKANDGDKFLLLAADSGNYRGNWVDLSGLHTIGHNCQSGNITLENLDKSLDTKYLIDSNEIVKIIKNGINISVNTAITVDAENSHGRMNSSNTISKNENAPVVLPTVVIYYDVDLNTYPDYYSLFWLFGGGSSYQDLYVSGGGTTGIVKSGSGYPGNQENNVAVVPTFISPDKPIIDLKEELKCFTIDNNSVYKIIVNVNEPYPGSRDMFNPLAEYSVGHTFLTLEQYKNNGTIIIRNVGFYPKNYAKAGHPVDESTFGDDSYTPFDVSLELKVNGSEFNTVTNTLINQQDYNYDVNNFNCTNSPINALKRIDINLPDTKATEIIFTGNNPADLGEDLRKMNLGDWNAANGNRQGTIIVSDDNNRIAPPRQGICN